MSGHPRGFTLLELLFAVALLGLLAALAWPGYQQSIQRALRQDARLALLRIQHRQEQHFSTHHFYAGEPGGSLRSDSGHYVLSLTTSAAGSRYLATARVDPLRRQASDVACAALSVDETGRRRSADAAGNWRDEDPERCWG